jgi:hypothetical protein
MAVIVKVLVPPKFLEVNNTIQYTAPVNTKAIIDKATAVNTSTSARLLSVNLATGGASSSNLVIDKRVIAPNETYSCPELIGQVLEPGTTIQTSVSGASAVNFRVSGREIA